MGELLKSTKGKLAIAGAVVGVILIAVVALVLMSGDKLPPPNELESLALDDQLPEDQRVKAALQLSEHRGAAQTQLRKVLTESKDSDVRAAAVQGLTHNGDWNDVPLMIDTLNDPSPWVRARAAKGVWRMMGSDFEFNPNDPPEKRAAAIEEIKRQYKWHDDYRTYHHDAPG